MSGYVRELRRGHSALARSGSLGSLLTAALADGQLPGARLVCDRSPLSPPSLPGNRRYSSPGIPRIYYDFIRISSGFYYDFIRILQGFWFDSGLIWLRLDFGWTSAGFGFHLPGFCLDLA